MPKSKRKNSKKTLTAAQVAATGFEPCDSNKYPMVSIAAFKAGMARMTTTSAPMLLSF